MVFNLTPLILIGHMHSITICMNILVQFCGMLTKMFVHLSMTHRIEENPFKRCYLLILDIHFCSSFITFLDGLQMYHVKTFKPKRFVNFNFKIN